MTRCMGGRCTTGNGLSLTVPLAKGVSLRCSTQEQTLADPAQGSAHRTFVHHWFGVIPPRGGAAAARRAHNPKAGGSNPPPATCTQAVPNRGRPFVVPGRQRVEPGALLAK